MRRPFLIKSAAAASLAKLTVQTFFSSRWKMSQGQKSRSSLRKTCCEVHLDNLTSQIGFFASSFFFLLPFLISWLHFLHSSGKDSKENAVKSSSLFRANLRGDWINCHIPSQRTIRFFFPSLAVTSLASLALCQAASF